ncbi:hypothetical protein T4B_1956 [Trichinella pseudospiralis]|uniref:Uncharacterized protein n=1 Tax=Trichinella pseudospiralis TaxID=6337 RepID=A0A0V1JA31_TRIPS|nr:hypothetical protein T4B_1956 [Trichinella pseudospiralis]KRZ37787.1 hypothetical protein T4C_2170 [Trichinella pseudospiralis]
MKIIINSAYIKLMIVKIQKSNVKMYRHQGTEHFFMIYTIEYLSIPWAYTKIGTIQRRLAWPLRKDDTQIREAFQIFYSSTISIIPGLFVIIFSFVNPYFEKLLLFFFMLIRTLLLFLSFQ